MRVVQILTQIYVRIHIKIHPQTAFLFVFPSQITRCPAQTCRHCRGLTPRACCPWGRCRPGSSTTWAQPRSAPSCKYSRALTVPLPLGSVCRFGLNNLRMGVFSTLISCLRCWCVAFQVCSSAGIALLFHMVVPFVTAVLKLCPCRPSF